MNRRNLIIGICALLCITNTGWLAYQHFQNKPTAVIDIIRVFNEFKLKKDLEGRVEVKLSEFSNTIDSSKAAYNAMLKANARSTDVARLSGYIDTLQYNAQRAYDISNKKINEEVWLRLNTLMEEYGKVNNYNLIIGANGMGTVLYNRKGLDKTDEVIMFINNRYEKGF